MKTIGLIGGMSWESSLVYYQLINEIVREKRGGFHSCKSILLSVDFAEIEALQKQENWQELDSRMADAAHQLEKAGADMLILCTNTMHLCSEAIMKRITIPFLHIARATALEIKDCGLEKVALLGTRFTMEKDFYKKILTEEFGIEVITPAKADRKVIHSIIYGELVHGQLLDASRKKYVAIIHKLEKEGAQGVILGCTEIPLLISNKDVNIPTFDTTRVHAEKAVEWALI